MDDLEGMDELDLTEVEREICRLPDVSIARLVAEPTGRVSEVHVVAHPGKHPKQIARDVQSIALASFGLELDRRIISVVQLGGDAFEREAHVRGFRASVVAITAESNGLRSLVRVTLARDDEESVGFAEGSVATTARHRLVATATVDALRQLEPAAECIDVDHAQILRVGAHDIAVVTVVFVLPPSEQLVSGSAIVRPQQEADAVARAANEHHGHVVFRHHDLPWQRRHLAHLATELPPRLDGALHATINLRSRRELEARGFAGATTVHNFFALDPAPGDRAATRAQFGFADDELVVLQPSRAIERKNVPGAVRFAAYLARRMPDRPVHLWIAGPAEDGYADTFARIVERSDVPVTIGRADQVANAYAACDVVVFPSTWEGFGNPVIESIAARRACAAFPYPVLSEIVAAGVRCFSTEEPDVVVRFLAETEQRRETYFDVNLRRARLSYSLTDLPVAIEHAFNAHGWSS